MSFACLATVEGESFRNDCKKAGKKIMVWTVNAREEMMQVS
jgi:phosphatidylglycerol phospholipase C